MENKNELLSQLKITDDDTKKNELNVSHLIVASMSAAIAAGLLVYFLFVPELEQQLQHVITETPDPQHQINSSVSATEISAGSREQKIDESAKFQFSNSEEILNASGYITARRIATVSAEAMGLIKSVNVEEGMKVSSGQILATLDDSVASVSVRLAKARVDVLRTRITATEIDLQESKRVLKRLKKLDEESYSSESQITKAQAGVDKLQSLLVSSRADIIVAQLQAEQQQELLDNHTIRAPFAGIVTVKNAQPGEIVAPSSAGGGFTRTGICTIVDMDSLEIEVDVNEAYIGRVKKDQQVKANLDAYPSWNIPASVIAIIPTADRAKATVRVRIRIEVKDNRILPDMGVKVAFLRTDK